MIDKKQLLWGVTSDDDKLMLSRMCDLAQRAEKTGRYVYSRFLNPGEQMLIESKRSVLGEVSFFGGYDGADRCVASFLGASWDELKYPIRVLKIILSAKKTYSHRDYLGSVLALGIDRELTGDIVVTEDGAYVFVIEDIADFIEMNLFKVASSTVKIVPVDNPEEIVIKRQFKETSATVSSLRFDCVLSAVANKSRSASASLIEEGLASVNYDVVKNTSFQIKDKDVISLKGFGKVIVETDGALTKKGRIHLNFKKYV